MWATTQLRQASSAADEMNPATRIAFTASHLLFVNLSTPRYVMKLETMKELLLDELQDLY